MDRPRTCIPIAVGAILSALLCLVSAAHAWQVGHRTVTWTDPVRADRAIQTDVYYPADSAGENVPVGGDGTVLFPVVAFGHGFLMSVNSYEYLWTGLVPVGYILALPRTEGSFAPDHGEFGGDLAFLVDRLRADGSDPASFLFGRVAANAAVAGHSMGGGASVLAAAGNPTVTAVVNLAAANTNPSAIDAAPAVSAPVLMFSGSVDCVAPPGQHQAPIYAALGSLCRTRATLEGASHCQFAESNFFCSLGEGGCAAPALTRTQQHALTLSLVRPWLDHFLKGTPGAWTTFQDLLASTGGVSFEQSCATSGIVEGAEDGRANGPADGDPAHGNDTTTPASRSRLDLRLSPNPFRPGAGAGLAIRTGAPITGLVAASIHAVDGRSVNTLSWVAAAGGRLAMWDGRDREGRLVPPGVYRIRVQIGNRTDAGTVVIVSP